MKLARDVPLLTVSEAAQRARVSRRTIFAWIKAGYLVPIPGMDATLIRLDQLGELIGYRHKHGRLPPRHA